MSMKKIMLLASMALAAVAVMAPATASAQGFQIADAGVPVKTGTKVTLSGTAGFENTTLGVGVRCTVHATLEAETSTVGHTQFTITTNTCVFTGAFTSGCTTVSDEPVYENAGAGTHEGWVTEAASANTLSITDVTINATNDGFPCVLGSVELAFEKITATVNNAAAISSVTLSGTGTNGGVSVCAFGTLNVTPAGTYQIIKD